MASKAAGPVYFLLDGPYFDPPTCEGIPALSPVQAPVEQAAALQVLARQAAHGPRREPPLHRALKAVDLVRLELVLEGE